MDISKETAETLQRTASEFQAADEQLRSVREPTQQTEFVQEAATNYLEKRRAHQEAIEAAEQETQD